MAESLLNQANQLDAFASANALRSPSHDYDYLSGIELPQELQSARSALINGSNDLKKLAMGPVVHGTELCLGWTDTLALRFIYHYRLAEHVPLTGSISRAAIAAAVNLPEPLVFRFVRAGMASNIFDETPSGEIRHTALSHLLATSQGFADIVGLEVEELAPAGSSYIAALEKWGAAGMCEPNRTAFALANGVEDPMFAFLAQEPERAKRFGGAMKFWTAGGSWDLSHIAAAFDWTQLDRPGAKIVDVGGGKGHVSAYLAQRTKSVQFLVQDLPHVVEEAQNQQLPEGLQGRISFKAHNFMTPQPPEEKPDAFLLRWIFHDWPEPYAVKILQSLVPALRPGAKILIYEYVLEDEPVKDITQKTGLQLDMIMAACFNGQERTREGFRKLLGMADARFVISGFKQPQGSTQSLVEVTWEPGSS